MGNSSAAGSLLKKGLAWIIVIAVAILAFKIVVAAIAGLLQTLFALVLIVVVGMAVVWAMRRL
jgi:predicted anti-sigma-YlaC factor YlaD